MVVLIQLFWDGARGTLGGVQPDMLVLMYLLWRGIGYEHVGVNVFIVEGIGHEHVIINVFTMERHGT